MIQIFYPEANPKSHGCHSKIFPKKPSKIKKIFSSRGENIIMGKRGLKKKKTKILDKKNKPLPMYKYIYIYLKRPEIIIYNLPNIYSPTHLKYENLM
ncbi:uncharacterized protein VTP21DRAFT_5675 [Calcarisporiella thermophila]|uniref:uncharacterized protein n=1 Tax=Calcarisporiella thermophila TaxID=911321 RepID=UPI0037443687